MRIIEVDTVSIRTQIEQLKSCLDATKNTVNELTESIESLRSMWTGEAHDEFVVQCMKNRQDMEDMCQILENVIESMTQAGAGYDQCENDVADAISAFRLP